MRNAVQLVRYLKFLPNSAKRVSHILLFHLFGVRKQPYFFTRKVTTLLRSNLASKVPIQDKY